MTSREQQAGGKRFAHIVLLLLVTTLMINLLSGYIRHLESGLDCEPWPQCYARVADYIFPQSGKEITQKALSPSEGVKKAHRAVATALVVLVLLIIQQGRQANAGLQYSRNLPYALAGVMLVLAVIGPASYLKTLPAVAMGNLAGGMVLLALTWWLWLQLSATPTQQVGGLKRLARWGLVLLSAQVALGGWVSANFAAVACPELFGCSADLPSGQSGASFWYLRELVLDENGRIVIDQGSALIHTVHRIGAVVTSLALLVLGIQVWRRGGSLGGNGLVVLGLLVAQLLLGLSAVIWGFPLVAVLAHNLVAALLLLAVIRLNYCLR